MGVCKDLFLKASRDKPWFGASPFSNPRPPSLVFSGNINTVKQMDQLVEECAEAIRKELKVVALIGSVKETLRDILPIIMEVLETTNTERK